MSLRKYFGTDGIRGKANIFPLDPETVVKIGKAIAYSFQKQGKKKIIIGKDTRLSGYLLENALATGINSMGVDVVFVGPIPTAGIAYLTKSMRADAGVMISASHNPFEDNGIKIFSADGLKLPDDVELKIEELIDEIPPTQHVEPNSIGKAYRLDDAIGRYTVNLKNNFSRDYTLEKFKLGLDCANGASYVVAPQTFEELGASVVVRGNVPNGKNINAGFGSEYPDVIKSLVKEYNLDFGFAYDGDADRCIIVDSSGLILDGDMILAILAKDLKSRNLLRNDLVVGTVMSNMGLELFLKDLGIKLHRAKVGDRYVLEDLDRLSGSLGGEQSGHTIFRDVTTCGDGILTSLMILETVCRTNKTISQLLDGFKKFPQKIVNIKVNSKPELSTIPEISSVISKKEKELGDTGRILVRYSGTENKARIMVECENSDHCTKHANDLAEVLERCIGAI